MTTLNFKSRALEADFAGHFGYRCRVPSFLLSTVLGLIWLTRFLSVQVRLVPYRHALSVLCVVMATVHSFNAVAILRFPAVCCVEARKIKLFVADALACMFTVVVYVGREELTREGLQSSMLLVSSPLVVYSIHGWSLPFAGFRFAADLFLHGLNFQMYVIMRIQQELTRSGPVSFIAVAKSAFAAFCICSLIPLFVNLFYEANIRSSYLTQRRLTQAFMGPFWQTVSRYSYYPGPTCAEDVRPRTRQALAK